MCVRAEPSHQVPTKSLSVFKVSKSWPFSDWKWWPTFKGFNFTLTQEISFSEASTAGSYSILSFRYLIILLSYRIYVLLLEVDESWQASASWAAAGRDSNRSSPTFLRTVITSFPSFRKCDACDVGDAKCGDGGGLRRHDVHHHCHVCCGIRGRDGLQDRSRHPRLCHLHLRPSYCLSNVVLKRLSCRQDV